MKTINRAVVEAILARSALFDIAHPAERGSTPRPLARLAEVLLEMGEVVGLDPIEYLLPRVAAQVASVLAPAHGDGTAQVFDEEDTMLDKVLCGEQLWPLSAPLQTQQRYAREALTKLQAEHEAHLAEPSSDLDTGVLLGAINVIEGLLL